MPTTTYSPGAGSISITGAAALWKYTYNPGTATIVLHGGIPVWSSTKTNFSGTALFIGNTQFAYAESSGQISKVLSAPRSASFDVYHRSGDPYPVPGQEVAFFYDSVKRFGGIVQSVMEAAIKGSFTVSRLTVQCTGYEAYMDRVIVAKLYTIATGDLPSVTLFDLIGMLAQFGVTQPYPQGPNVDLGVQLFHYVTVREAVNTIKDACSGYDYWIDDDKVFHFSNTEPSGATAPFTLRDSDHNVDEMSVTTSNARFRNKQNVLPYADLYALKSDTFTATAGQTSFITTYAIGSVKPLVSLNGSPEAVTTLGVWDGSPWYYIVDSNSIFRSPGAPALSGGDAVVVSYPNPFPVAVVAQNDASIAAMGLYEMVYQSKTVVDAQTAANVAQGLLDLYGTDGDYPQAVTFQYNSQQQSAWLEPGEVIDIIRTFPTASGLYTIEQVDSQMQDDPAGSGGPGVWRDTVTCRAGLGDVTDAMALDAFRTAARVGINSPPARATFELDITNAGQSTGVQPNRFIVQLPPGIISVGLASWDAWFPEDPPTGDDWIADVLVSTDGGVSYTTIFPAGDANKMVVPDGSNLQASGIRFATDNMRLPDGAILEVNVLQVGSTTPGKYCVSHINFVQ